MTQTPVRNPAPQAATPVPAAPGAASSLARPLTQQDIRALRSTRSDMTAQLKASQQRRDAIAEQLMNPIASDADKQGLQSRLVVLDKSMLELETGIADAGRLIATAPSQLISSTEQSGPRGELNSGQVTAISIVFTLAVFAPIAVAFARRIWRGASRPAPAQLSPDTTLRLDRMEQGIEAIAIEIERVAEGQRFVTNLMSDRPARAIEARELR